jgi:Mg-chelatase subunit ChlD
MRTAAAAALAALTLEWRRRSNRARLPGFLPVFRRNPMSAGRTPTSHSWLAVLAVVAAGAACESSGPAGSSSNRAARDVADAAPYQAEAEEGLGAAVAILVDTSGSMKDAAPGDSRPKSVVAREALEAMLDATDAVVARRSGFPIKVGVYSFSSSASTLLPIQLYDRDRVRAALAQLPRPGGGTAIGEALRTARPALYRAGVFRKYLLVVTDGENTAGRSPDEVAREIWRKSEGAVQIHFVAFDTSPDKFAFLREVGGSVMTAANGLELKKALDDVYQGKILAEAVDAGEKVIRK